MRLNAFLMLIAIALTNSPALALDPDQPGIFVRVIDVGAGLACVIKFTDTQGDSEYMLYDTGNFRNRRGSGDNRRIGVIAFEEIKSLIPDNEELEMVVLSHTDSDHIAATPQVCDRYQIKKFLRTGWQRTGDIPGAWTKAIEAVEEEVAQGAEDINQADPQKRAEHGTQYRLGDATLTLVSGFGDVPDDWVSMEKSKRRNAISIVIRLEYMGRSILFCGDAVGAKDDDDEKKAIATEKYMLRNAGDIPIQANVIIPAHHGANNGSSPEFITAVSPKFVIFSAGSHNRHPHSETAARYQNVKSVRQIFRTDLGDNEPPRNGSFEWQWRRTDDGDRSGDDSVDIHISPEGVLTVAYKNPSEFRRPFFVNPN